MPSNLWRERAQATTDYCLKSFWDEQAKKFRPATPTDPRALPWEFMWGNGVAFSMLVGAGDKARMATFFEGQQGYWDTRALIPGYDAYLSSPGNSDKYYDDNAWMVLTFIEAYEKTGEKKYLLRATEALRFVLSGWDGKLGGGIYWREDLKSKNTCSNGPSAMAALAVARHLNPRYYIAWAQRITDWANGRLQDADGLFFDNCDLGGKIERTKWTYNAALMLRTNLSLWKVTGEKHYLIEANRIAVASEKVFVEPSTQAFRDEANFSHLLVEAFLELYQETKAPYLRARAEACGNFTWTHLRDSDGGHWTKWRMEKDRKQMRKTLMDNASVARLYWLLAQ
ncbi:glycoside hydrolase family 76 protein [Armatimonas sp.]|uniref:glycoside hydrolase family 76 protein n=1 Tax=Armatimonas sp. TaxID=1872638 RepID=UPI00375172C6